MLRRLGFTGGGAHVRERTVVVVSVEAFRAIYTMIPTLEAFTVYSNVSCEVNMSVLDIGEEY